MQFRLIPIWIQIRFLRLSINIWSKLRRNMRYQKLIVFFLHIQRKFYFKICFKYAYEFSNFLNFFWSMKKMHSKKNGTASNLSIRISIFLFRYTFRKKNKQHWSNNMKLLNVIFKVLHKGKHKWNVSLPLSIH